MIAECSHCSGKQSQRNHGEKLEEQR
uniref:Uncharacterized protein n=1 Tax=Lotus japonicus TaxID=34305 RepID=I3T298_LOTJA|nr:unknown [Lotus japonicus]